jgi:hypothetical protein
MESTSRELVGKPFFSNLDFRLTMIIPFTIATIIKSLRLLYPLLF